jgi:transcriptional regulator with XRE-family HTH domain
MEQDTENAAYPDRHRLPADLAAELRAVRLGRGLGLRQVAREIGASPGYLTLLEQGKRCPSRAFAVDLAAALNLDPRLTARLFDVARHDVGRSRTEPRSGARRMRV